MVKSVKILGITIDEYLTFNEQLQASLNKCYKIFLCIPSKNTFSRTKRLIQSLIFGTLRYGITIWASNLSQKYLNKINKLITARFVLDMRKFNSFSQLICNSLKWMLAKEIIMHENIMLTYQMTFCSDNAITKKLTFPTRI